LTHDSFLFKFKNFKNFIKFYKIKKSQVDTWKNPNLTHVSCFFKKKNKKK